MLCPRQHPLSSVQGFVDIGIMSVLIIYHILYVYNILIVMVMVTMRMIMMDWLDLLEAEWWRLIDQTTLVCKVKTPRWRTWWYVEVTVEHDKWWFFYLNCILKDCYKQRFQIISWTEDEIGQNGRRGAVGTHFSWPSWGKGGKEEETYIPTNGCRFLDKLLRNAILRLPLPRSSK